MGHPFLDTRAIDGISTRPYDGASTMIGGAGCPHYCAFRRISPGEPLRPHFRSRAVRTNGIGAYGMTFAGGQVRSLRAIRAILQTTTIIVTKMTWRSCQGSA